MNLGKKIDCRDLDQQGLIDFVEKLGQPSFRAKQIMGWLYRPGITGFEEMTDLAKSFRAILEEYAYISRLEKFVVETSTDGTLKFGFTLKDGAVIESVLIPEPDRNTLCISTQVGCAMDCTFCMTSKMGYARNLSPAEIVNQVCAVRDYLQNQTEKERIGPPTITNIVYMGMGEPLNNFANLLTSISILTDQKGLDMASRRITVSTCGIIPRMHALGEVSSVNLAVSLHSVDNETRDMLMPINKRYPIEHLLQACRDYPIQKRKRIMIEYIMLDSVNDSDQQARILVKLLHKTPCKINLLPFNECAGIPYKPSSKQRILAFQEILRKAHYSVFIRSSRGGDIAAACGQLAGQLKEARDGS